MTVGTGSSPMESDFTRPTVAMQPSRPSGFDQM